MPEPKATWSPEGLSDAMARLVTVPYPAGLKPDHQEIPPLVKELLLPLMEKVPRPELLLTDNPDPMVRQMATPDHEELADQLSQHPMIVQIQQEMTTDRVQNRPAQASNPAPVESLEEWLENLRAAQSQ